MVRTANKGHGLPVGAVSPWPRKAFMHAVSGVCVYVSSLPALLTPCLCCPAPPTACHHSLQAMAATSEAISQFEAEGVAWLRPPDYYAEMVKSDEQMARIKDRLMYEQQQIDQAAERWVLAQRDEPTQQGG